MRFVLNPSEIGGSIEIIGRKVASGDLNTLRYFEQSGCREAINRLTLLEVGPLHNVGGEKAVALQKKAMEFSSLWFGVSSSYLLSKSKN